MAEVLGLNYVLKQSTNTLGGATDVSLTINGNLVDASNKDGSGWEAKLPGLKSWSISADAHLIEDDTVYAALEAALLAGTSLSITISTPAANTYSGTCYVESISHNGPTGDILTCSISLVGSGALTKA